MKSKLCLTNDTLLVLLSAFVRSAGVGYLGVVFAFSLVSLGLTATQIGLLVSLGLAGGAVGTLGVALFADRFGRRHSLILLSLLSIGGGVGFSFRPGFIVMIFIAFIGMINGMGRDRGAAASLEQAILGHETPPADKTPIYVFYWVVVDVGMALGSLMGGAGMLQPRGNTTYSVTFLLYTALSGLTGVLYFFLPSKWDIRQKARQTVIQPHSRKKILHLSYLSALDSFAGGFLTSTLIAYWLYVRFDLNEMAVGTLFFLGRIANILSYFAAGWLARRIGLLYTMVFTHLPSHFLLFGMAYAPTFFWVAVLFLLRECLVEMDVPTRQAYLSAMVEPHEQTFATGVVNLTRTAAWSIAPVFSGYAMASLSMFTPLIAGGSLKIIYDGLLWYSFRNVRPLHPNDQKQHTKTGIGARAGHLKRTF